MRLDRLLLGERMEASLSVQVQVQPQEEGASRIQSSRDGSGGDGDGDGVGRGRSVSGARRPSWFRRALGGLLMWKHPASTVEAPARARELERVPTERPRCWGSSLKKAVASALARVCNPVCSGVREDDVVDPRGKRRRRRRRGTRCRARSPLDEDADDYWTFAFRGRTASLTDEMLMRRFVLEEDAMRRRMEIRAAAGLTWSPPGPSRLSQMSLAGDDDNNGPSRRLGETEALSL